MFKGMTRPWDETFRIIHMSDVEQPIKMRNNGLDIIDFAPLLLDNDKISLLVVLLIVPGNEIRFQGLQD